jgi:hypothetical protein
MQKVADVVDPEGLATSRLVCDAESRQGGNLTGVGDILHGT